MKLDGLETLLNQLAGQEDGLTLAVAQMVASDLVRERGNVSLVLLNQGRASSGPFLDYITETDSIAEAKSVFNTAGLRAPERFQDYLRSHIQPGIKTIPFNANRKGMNLNRPGIKRFGGKNG